MSTIYDELDAKKIKDIRLHVEDNSKIIDDIVNSIIQPYCKGKLKTSEDE